MKMKSEIQQLQNDYGVSLKYIANRAGVGYKALYNYTRNLTHQYSFENTLKVLGAVKAIRIDCSLIQE